MTIAVSTNFLRPRSVEQVIELCEAAGVTSVEIWGHDGIFADAEDLSGVAAKLHAREIAVCSVHAPYTADSILRPEDRESYLQRFEQVCSKACVLNAGRLVVHPAVLANERPNAGGTIAEAMPASFALWKNVADRARRRELRVAFENLPRSTGWPDGCRLSVVRRIADELRELDAAICLDLSHSLANQEEPFPPSDSDVTPLVVHVSDGIAGNDRHLPLGEGDHDWARIGNELCRKRYSGPLVLEVRSPYLDGRLIGLMARYLKERFNLASETPDSIHGEHGFVLPDER